MHVCPDCQGIGYYKEAVPFGHPHFSVLFPCHCELAEKEQRAQEELLRVSNLGSFRDKTFDRFNPDVPEVRVAYERALHSPGSRRVGWCCSAGTERVKPTWPLQLPMRCCAATSECCSRLSPICLTTCGPASDVGYDERFELIRSVPVLILDDLGIENTTLWAREKLFQILNYRSNEALPTVITRNRKLDDLDPRVASRIADRSLGQCVTLTAEDYRRREEP